MEERTPEQLSAEKKEKFEANPDQFIDMEDLIVVIKRDPKGLSHYIGKATVNELHIAKSKVQFYIDEIFRIMAIDARIAKTRDKRIITKGAFGLRRNS